MKMPIDESFLNFVWRELVDWSEAVAWLIAASMVSFGVQGAPEAP